MKKYFAEMIGTMVLVLMGCGSAVIGATSGSLGTLGISFAFGLAVIAMAYAIGPISGCHINPAVSLAVLISKKMSVTDFIGYVVAQIVGAIAGAGLLKMIVGFGVADLTGGLGSNGVAAVGIGGALVVEIILTFIFVFTILGVTSDESKGNVAGIVIGLTLAFVHIVGIPLTGTSVNPARSIGPALLTGGAALADVWVFIAAPLVGAALAAFVFIALENKHSNKGKSGKKA